MIRILLIISIYTSIYMSSIEKVFEIHSKTFFHVNKKNGISGVNTKNIKLIFLLRIT